MLPMNATLVRSLEIFSSIISNLSIADPWCTGGENGIGANDICMGNFASMGLAAMQYKIINDTIPGHCHTAHCPAHSRTLRDRQR